jgi:hypothetical protein
MPTDRLLLPIGMAVLLSSIHVGCFFIWNCAGIRDHTRFPVRA